MTDQGVNEDPRAAESGRIRYMKTLARPRDISEVQYWVERFDPSLGQWESGPLRPLDATGPAPYGYVKYVKKRAGIPQEDGGRLFVKSFAADWRQVFVSGRLIPELSGADKEADAFLPIDLNWNGTDTIEISYEAFGSSDAEPDMSDLKGIESVKIGNDRASAREITEWLVQRVPAPMRGREVDFEFSAGGWKSGTVWSLSWRLAIYAVLGVGIGAVVFFGSAYALLNTPRGSAIVGKFAFGAQSHVFELGTPLYYVTAVLRQFAADIAGTGDAYIGWRNYYEGPLSYCTLAAFLLSPQAFVGATRRQRILYGSFLCLVAVPVVFPWFRSLFWLFRGDYFRTFSLFTIFVLLVLSTIGVLLYLRLVSRGGFTTITGKAYRPRSFAAAVKIPGQTQQAAFAPGKWVEDVLVFDVPPADFKFVRLELPCATCGGTGSLNLEIPRRMITFR